MTRQLCVTGFSEYASYVSWVRQHYPQSQAIAHRRNWLRQVRSQSQPAVSHQAARLGRPLPTLSRLAPHPFSCESARSLASSIQANRLHGAALCVPRASAGNGSCGCCAGCRPGACAARGLRSCGSRGCWDTRTPATRSATSRRALASCLSPSCCAPRLSLIIPGGNILVLGEVACEGWDTVDSGKPSSASPCWLSDRRPWPVVLPCRSVGTRTRSMLTDTACEELLRGGRDQSAVPPDPRTAASLPQLRAAVASAAISGSIVDQHRPTLHSQCWRFEVNMAPCRQRQRTSGQPHDFIGAQQCSGSSRVAGRGSDSGCNRQRITRSAACHEQWNLNLSCAPRGCDVAFVHNAQVNKRMRRSRCYRLRPIDCTKLGVTRVTREQRAASRKGKKAPDI